MSNLLDANELQRRLDRISVARFALDRDTKPEQLHFAVNRDERQTVVALGDGLELSLAPMTSSGSPPKPAFVGVLATDAPSAMLIVEPSGAPLPEAGDAAEFLHVAPQVRVAIAAPGQPGELSHDMAERICRSMVVSDGASVAFAPFGQTAVVLGTRLERGEVSFTRPGEGTWSLLTFLGPVFGHLALDLDAGVAELRSKDRFDATLGDAMLRALR